MEVPEESKIITSPSSPSWNCRPRLLHNYGASFLTMAHKAYRKVAELNGPIGSLARTLASVASPIVQPLQHQWLSILSFIDNQILAIEDVAMFVFPPSAHVFNKIDEVALLADSLPKKLDDTMEGLVMLIHQLFSSESSNSSDGKDIMVDIKCDEQPKTVTSSEEESENKIDDKSGALSNDNTRMLSQIVKDDIREVEETCNEITVALEKMEMVEEKKKGAGSEGVVEQHADEAAAATRDAILELFDEGWQLKPLRGKKGQ